MIPEIQLGVHFIVLNFLVNKLPKRKVGQFAKELTECLKLKFKGHWYPKTPDRGTAFRFVWFVLSMIILLHILELSNIISVPLCN